MRYTPKYGLADLTPEQSVCVTQFCKGYASFIDYAKTERRANVCAQTIAKQFGFKDLSEYDALQPGDKVIINNRGKGIIFAVIGQKPIREGVNIIASHIDVPRLDLKQNPLFEDSNIAFFKTTYYGGIKKYQWTCVPLALHGIAVRTDGEVVDITIGEEPGDPVLMISDLLPHLAQDQMKKTLAEGITGESLNAILGIEQAEEPSEDKSASEDKPAKPKKSAYANILKILNEKYGLIEEDLLSAEFELVPADDSRDVGLDRAMLAAYGHDDRVCAYTSLMAVAELGIPERTAVCMLADKEEVGSMGNGGLQSRFYSNALLRLMHMRDGVSDNIAFMDLCNNSYCLSADVAAAYDPNYKEVQEVKNAPKLGHGIVLTKYTGGRGKGGSNDADAEYMSMIRRIWNDADVVWQIGELGKVDQGGGGTVAMFVANYNIRTIDCGVALLSMHAPMEIAAKYDIYMAYKAYKAFYQADC